MLGLASLATRRRSASLLTAAMLQAGGGGGRLLGFGSSAPVGASGVRSPFRPSFNPFALASGGRRKPFSSSVPPKSDREMVMEKLEEVLRSTATVPYPRYMRSWRIVKHQHTIEWICFHSFVSLVVCYSFLHLAYSLGVMTEHMSLVSFAKAKIHELCQDEEFLRDYDAMVERAIDRFMRRINPFSSLTERWGSSGEAMPASVDFESAVVPVDSKWVQNGCRVAKLLQVMSNVEHPIPLTEDRVIHLAMGFFGYNKELAMELLSALVSIGFIKKRAGRKGEASFYEIINRKSVSANLLMDKEFLNKLIEAEKAKAKK